MLLLSIFAPVFGLVAVVLGQDGGDRFYAYGSGIRGLPLFYADGTAYIGNVSPPNASTATNVTLTQNTDDGTFTAAPINASTSTTGEWSSPQLYIDNSSGAFANVGFTSSSNATVTTTGFGLFGTLLVWISESGDITTKWYADPIDTNLWQLKWNVDNVATDTAAPVVLKNRAPSTITAR